MTDVNNSADVIDSRDVIARIEELEAERTAAPIHEACRHCGLDIEGSEDDFDWRDRGNNSKCNDGNHDHEPPEGTKGELDEDDTAELAALKAFAEEAEGYCEDWTYGATLVRESYFVDYCRELVADIGDMPREMPSYVVIDWEATAKNIAADYTEVDFDGVAYLVR